MRADVFHSVKLSLMAEDGHKAITYTEFTSLAFGDVINTGESDHAGCLDAHGTASFVWLTCKVQQSQQHIGQQVYYQDKTHPGELAVQAPHTLSICGRDKQQHTMDYIKSHDEQ